MACDLACLLEFDGQPQSACCLRSARQRRFLPIGGSFAGMTATGSFPRPIRRLVLCRHCIGARPRMWPGNSPLPGRGTSSPIIVAGRVFVTCSSGPRQDRLHVLALNVASGQVIWQRQFTATGRTICHPMTAVAAPTPASDGQRVFAYFSSNDLVALDIEGNLLWMRALCARTSAVRQRRRNGLVAARGRRHRGRPSRKPRRFLRGGFRGRFRRRTLANRSAQRGNWSSPTLLHRTADSHNDLVLLQSPEGLSAIEPATGREAWSFKTTCNEITSAITAGDTIFLPGGSGIQAPTPKIAGSGRRCGAYRHCGPR